MPKPVSKPVEYLGVALLAIPMWAILGVIAFYAVKLVLHMAGVFF